MCQVEDASHAQVYKQALTLLPPEPSCPGRRHSSCRLSQSQAHCLLELESRLHVSWAVLQQTDKGFLPKIVLPVEPIGSLSQTFIGDLTSEIHPLGSVRIARNAYGQGLALYNIPGNKLEIGRLKVYLFECDPGPCAPA